MNFRRFITNINQKWLIAGALFFVVVATSLGTYFGWIRGADHRDFYPLWAGARRVQQGFDDLYSDEAARSMQISLYGRVIPPDHDQQAFAYPALLIPIILPFAWIEDVEIATALWEAISVLLMIVGLYLLQAKTGSYSILPILLSLFWFFTLLMVFQGQTTGLVIFSLCCGYWALSNGRDVLGGLLLSIGLVKPELTVVPILVLVVQSLRRRQFFFPFGLLVGSMALFLISLCLVGFWIPDWLAALARYSQYAQVIWPIAYVIRLIPWLGVLLGVVLVLGMLWLRDHEDRLFAMSIPFQLLVFPQTPIWGLSVHTVPMNLVWQRGQKTPVLLLWIFGWLTVVGNSLSANWWKIQTILVTGSVFFLILYSHAQRRENTS